MEIYIQFVLNYDCSRDMVRIDKIKVYLRYMPFDFYEQQDSLTKIISYEKELNKITDYADATIISGPDIYLLEYEGKNKLTAIYKARRGDKRGDLYIFSDGTHHFKEDVVHKYAGNIKIKIQYPNIRPPDYSEYNEQAAIMMNVGKRLWLGYCLPTYNYVTDTDISGYYSTSGNCSTTTHAIRPRGEYAVKDIKVGGNQYTPDYDWKYFWNSNNVIFTNTSGDNYISFLTAYSLTHLGYMFENTLGLSFSNQKAEFKPMHYEAPHTLDNNACGVSDGERVYIKCNNYTTVFHEWIHSIQSMNYAFSDCEYENEGLMGVKGWREGATYGLEKTFNTWIMQQDPNRQKSDCSTPYYSPGEYISWKYPNDWGNTCNDTGGNGWCRNCDFFKYLYDRIKFSLGPIRGLKNILASFSDLITEVSNDVDCPTFSSGNKSHYKAMNNYDSGNSVMPFITQVFKEHVDDNSIGFGSGIDELPGIFSGAILYKSGLGSTSVKPQTSFSSLGLLPGFDIDYLSFWANSGESYTIAVSSTIQMCIVTYQPDTTFISSTCGSNPILNITGPGSEQNFVNVKIYKRYSSDTGTTYTVNISVSDDNGDNIYNATPIPIRSGNSGKRGRVETSEDYDYFSVYVPVNNAVVTFTTSAGDSPVINDTVIRLYNGFGTLLACNDDIGGGNLYSRIITDNSGGQGQGECSGSGVPNNPAQLNRGWYVIAVKGYGTNTGGYTIKAEISGSSDVDQADSNGVLRSDTYYGRRIASSFETSNDVDDYRVSLNAGDVIMISAMPLSSGVDTVVDILTAKNNPTYKSYTVNSRRVMIRDDNGRMGWDSGGSELRFVAPVTSDYIIRVFPSGVSPDSRYNASEQSANGSGNTGDYELDIRWYSELYEQINPEME